MRKTFSLAAFTVLLAACKPAIPPAPADNPLMEKPAAALEAAASLASSESHVGDLQVRMPRVLETPIAGGTGVGFLVVVNLGSDDDRLLSARSPAADSVEIHEMSMNDGVMRMRALGDGLAIPAGATVELAPGGIHLMLIAPKQPFAEGQKVAITLVFEKAGTVAVARGTVTDDDMAWTRGQLAYRDAPLAEVQADGRCVITKLDGSGGLVSELTVKEQLMYEVHDPRAYLTPDVSADFSQARVAQQGTDRVAIAGISGQARPAQFKAIVGFDGGFLAEGEISYAGPGAAGRAPAAGCSACCRRWRRWSNRCRSSCSVAQAS